MEGTGPTGTNRPKKDLKFYIDWFQEIMKGWLESCRYTVHTSMCLPCLPLFAVSPWKNQTFALAANLTPWRFLQRESWSLEPLVQVGELLYAHIYRIIKHVYIYIPTYTLSLDLWFWLTPMFWTRKTLSWGCFQILVPCNLQLFSCAQNICKVKPSVSGQARIFKKLL